MPPKAKKAAPGPKRTKPAAVKSQLKPHVTADEKIEQEVESKGKDLNFDLSGGDNGPKGKSFSDLNDDNQANGSTPSKKEDEVKEDEYEIDERLELEDNEPDYEPEEYGNEYDEKEVDDEEEEEEEEEMHDEGDEEEVDEEEADMGEDDLEDVQEEIEGEDDEHADAIDGPQHEEELEHPHNDDHTELIDAAEAQEHHDVVKERRKRKEYEVFVGGLDKDATEEDLRDVFGCVGEITEIRLMMNPQTKKNKGFAFLRFATVEQAKRAVTELRNPVVKGKQCGVTPSQDSDTLFLGNICKTWTMEKLREKLKLYGIDNIEDLTLVEDSNNDGRNRGFAFLEFASRSDAMDAFKRLQKRDVLLGVDRPAKVSFADSFIDPGDEIMAQVKTVFIDGLLASWDEDRVRSLLKVFGVIDKVELARNMPSARRKDFGFVTFDSHEAAVACAKSINNTDLGEGDHKAKVRCRLSRPLQRGGGKGKGYSRGDRGGRIPGRRLRAPWNRPLPRPGPPRVRGYGSRAPPAAKRPIRRAPPPMPARPRPLPPQPRSYPRRAPAPPPPKSSSKRDYPRREVAPPRSRAAEYGSRLPPERRSSSYRDEYASPRSPAYPEVVHRSSASRSATRRAYVDDSYSQRYERPPPSYREGRGRDYDSTMSGSKRPYSSVDDLPSRYADPGVRHSRARLDYDMPGGGSSHYDAYSDRLGRSTVGYSSSSRSSISAQDSHGVYSSRQGMGYGGSYGGSDVGGSVYSSSFGGDYSSRGSDVGGSSYSSLYGSRGMGGSSYMGGGSSGSYY